MTTADYHALLARQEAKRLRQSLLAALAATATPPAGPAPVRDPYADGGHDRAHDQWVITRDLPLVTPFGRLIAHLYDAMFDRHPYLRALFPDSMDFQRAHLERAFHHLVEHLHRPATLAAHCAALGRDHRRLGVRPVHFTAFEESLAEALRRSAGTAWTPELEGAWLRMLRCAVAAMVAGAEQAAGEPTYWNAEVTHHRQATTGDGGAVAVLRVRTSEPYSYRAGQYASVESPLLPQTWRPYALASAPGSRDAEPEFHVRVTGPGGVSEALALHTRPGDTLRLGPPRGTMTLDDAELAARDVLIVAAGTGWATAKALLEDLAARRPPGRAAHLVLTARSRAGLYDAAGLERLEERCPWLRVTLAPAAYADGADPLRHLGPLGGPAHHTAYVSGPPGMVDATVRALAERGLPQHRIHYNPAPPQMN
ncbi:globin domain-containing protein [Streptomyces sp. CC210A]|uniref:globin domain-containing protein n=1 Tax=Streptomyces sp. CC210A TaxID=2898184 RepID=UPI001F4011A9|nr:globin domain-containing protein [Streptomyces sp. CC210A]